MSTFFLYSAHNHVEGDTFDIVPNYQHPPVPHVLFNSWVIYMLCIKKNFVVSRSKIHCLFYVTTKCFNGEISECCSKGEEHWFRFQLYGMETLHAIRWTSMWHLFHRCHWCCSNTVSVIFQSASSPDQIHDVQSRVRKIFFSLFYFSSRKSSEYIMYDTATE